MVCSMTRGPAKPSRAAGSAMMMSHRVAKDAATPPKVGSVIRDRVRMPASSSSPSMLLVLAICMSEMTPSCMRAPPEAVTIRSGTRSRNASSPARVMASPTTEPRLPPMKRKSMAATITGCPSIRPRAHRTASSSPVRARVSRSRSWYGLESIKPSGSASNTGMASCSIESGSSSWLSRSLAVSGACQPQSAQTRCACTNLLPYSMARQPPHRNHRPGSLSRLAGVACPVTGTRRGADSFAAAWFAAARGGGLPLTRVMTVRPRSRAAPAGRSSRPPGVSPRRSGAGRPGRRMPRPS